MLKESFPGIILYATYYVLSHTVIFIVLTESNNSRFTKISIECHHVMIMVQYVSAFQSCKSNMLQEQCASWCKSPVLACHAIMPRLMKAHTKTTLNQLLQTHWISVCFDSNLVCWLHPRTVLLLSRLSTQSSSSCSIIFTLEIDCLELTLITSTFRSSQQICPNLCSLRSLDQRSEL